MILKKLINLLEIMPSMLECLEMMIIWTKPQIACPTFSLMEEYSQEQMRSSAMLIDRMNLTEDQMMNSRLKSKESNILLDRANEDDTDTGDGGAGNCAGIDDPNNEINNGDDTTQKFTEAGARCFPTLLTFIKGSLLREVTNDGDDDSDDENVSHPENLAENMNNADSQRRIKIPTMHGVLKKIEKKRTKETGAVIIVPAKLSLFPIVFLTRMPVLFMRVTSRQCLNLLLNI